MTHVAVLGSGMAGWGAAYRLNALGVRPVLYDQHSYYGGHTASFCHDGFVFDEGPHISFTKDPRIQEILAANVDHEYEAIPIHLNNYWRGYWPTHPVQLHLHGLPEDVVVKVIADFVAEQQRGERPIHNYADWLVASFGRAFAELFPMQYARKYHLTSAENLTTDWLGPRFYRPSLEEMLQGALSPSVPNVHYITHFRYPKQGGFAAYLHQFASLADLRLNHRLMRLDPRLRELEFENGARVEYDAVVSSIPLPDLISLIVGVPDDVGEAARRLACSTCVLVNLGIDRADLSPAHMTYFYDEDICFSRLTFPHLLSARNVPEGFGSIQAEVYFSSKYRPLTAAPDTFIEPVIQDLCRSGLLREEDRVVLRKAALIPYANIIFDHERAEALATVHGFLDDVGIRYCGRYGDWGYLWTDESFISGERAAEAALVTCAR
ncbi:MAG: protoporphyrinogen/coproporphyrinogen oxidase [Gemmatimonadales bacterium]